MIDVPSLTNSIQLIKQVLNVTDSLANYKTCFYQFKHVLQLQKFMPGQ